MLLLVSACIWWTFRQGYILYYGDAQAHLNISRSLLDSRTPGYEQIGTVWLPVLHLLCLPFVQSTDLWSTGLAGSIPVSLCFVVAGLFLYLTVRRVQPGRYPAVVAMLCFALNPNVLYLSVIPMTEIVFLAGLSVLVYAGCRFDERNRPLFVVLALAASWWMSLTRYDGWFLIPFAALWFGYSAERRKALVFVLFLLAASLAPIYWMAHSWYETSNPLDFFNGPYSAKAIQHGDPYPGFHDWLKAFLYYGTAAQLCTGWGLSVLALLGLLAARTRAVLLPTLFVLLPCAFYVWSIHSSGNPIHVPQLPPFSYYNTRYGIAFTFFAAFAAGSVACRIPASRARLAFILPVIAVAPWVLSPSRQSWICWKESQHNSQSRIAWTTAGAKLLKAHYREGQGILAPFSDVAGIFCRAQIPLAEVLHEGDSESWLPTLARPDLLHQQEWAIAQQDDRLDQSLGHSPGSAYKIFEEVHIEGAPTLKFYKRIF